MTPHDSMITVLDVASTALAGTLPGAINLVSTQRSADVPPGRLDAYVALGWMRWAAGRLLVTPKGAAMRDAVVAREESMDPAEGAELRRQGAKAAARGEKEECNPMMTDSNRPAATGEAPQTWAARSRAWQSGFASQATARDREPESDIETSPPGIDPGAASRSA
jgi:hypothetical protein